MRALIGRALQWFIRGSGPDPRTGGPPGPPCAMGDPGPPFGVDPQEVLKLSRAIQGDVSSVIERVCSPSPLAARTPAAEPLPSSARETNQQAAPTPCPPGPAPPFGIDPQEVLKISQAMQRDMSSMIERVCTPPRVPALKSDEQPVDRLDRLTLLADPAPVTLAQMVCARCTAIGVTVVTLLRPAGDPAAAYLEPRGYCTPDCARGAGWPWLTSETAPERGKRP